MTRERVGSPYPGGSNPVSGRPNRLLLAVALGLLAPPGDPEEGGSVDWREAPEDEELLPGDLGEGTEDLVADSGFTRRRVRRIPLSFAAVVLLLTLTAGIGMSAGLLAGPTPWDLVPPLHGSGGGTGSSGGLPGPSNTTLSPNGSTGPTPPGNTSHPGGTNRTGGQNSTGNGTGTGGSGPNGTQGNSSGNPGNSTGNGNGTGSGTGSGNGTPGNRSGGTTPIPRPPTKAPPITVYRAILPWLPSFHPDYLALVAAMSLLGLGGAVIYESFRPPPDRSNPWRGRTAGPRRARSRRRPVSAREALDLAVRRLRAELLAYTQRYGAATDAEVRQRIIQLYGALLIALSPGLGDLEGRTPREVEWLAVRYLGVKPPTAHELTWLFEEARYSSHPLAREGVVRAEKALASLMTDLQNQQAWAS